jgi:iron(III) transport system ATP-binding protein
LSAVEVARLTKRYGSQAVVDGIDLLVQDGEFVTLLGPSGCGKTTTLRCIAGLEKPDSGRISIAAELVTDGERGHFVPPNRRRLGMVFQSYALWPHMTVFGNVAYALKLQRRSGAAIDARVHEVLTLVGLEHVAGRDVSELSGGQQQRVALARALAPQPRVLLLDEPLSNLDASLRAHMRSELRRIHREAGTTSVYVTHDQLEAVTMSDRVVVLNLGRIEQWGTPHEVFAEPASRWVAQFVGFENFIEAEALEVNAEAVVALPKGSDHVFTCTLGRGTRRPTRGDMLTLAMRASSFRDVPRAGDNTLRAQVTDAIYVGDLTEYTLDAFGTRLTARLPAVENGSANGTLARGDFAELSVSRHQVVAWGASA